MLYGVPLVEEILYVMGLLDQLSRHFPIELSTFGGFCIKDEVTKYEGGNIRGDILAGFLARDYSQGLHILL